jgi:hypothetical protein
VSLYILPSVAGSGDNSSETVYHLIPVGPYAFRWCDSAQLRRFEAPSTFWYRMSAPPALLADALRGRYTLERELGRGGMATVYLAQDIRYCRPVAVKVLHPELAPALGPERFLREIAVAARLQHPHLLPLYDSGAAGDLLYYVMPYVPGGSLRKRLSREGQLPLDDASGSRARSPGAGLCPRAGVVHRDIKPRNSARGTRRCWRIFGIARAPERGRRGAAHRNRVTLAPGLQESRAGRRGPPSRRAERYLLAGLRAVRDARGRAPFTGPTGQAVMARHALIRCQHPHGSRHRPRGRPSGSSSRRSRKCRPIATPPPSSSPRR